MRFEWAMRPIMRMILAPSFRAVKWLAKINTCPYHLPHMDDSVKYSRAAFQASGKLGGKVRAKRYSKRALSAMAKRGWIKRRLAQRSKA